MDTASVSAMPDGASGRCHDGDKFGERFGVAIATAGVDVQCFLQLIVNGGTGHTPTLRPMDHRAKNARRVCTYRRPLSTFATASAHSAGLLQSTWPASLRGIAHHAGPEVQVPARSKESHREHGRSDGNSNCDRHVLGLFLFRVHRLLTSGTRSKQCSFCKH